MAAPDADAGDGGGGGGGWLTRLRLPRRPRGNFASHPLNPFTPRTRRSPREIALAAVNVRDRASSEAKPSPGSVAAPTLGLQSASWMVPWTELTLGDRLGAGAFGAVYRASWRRSEIAVKQLHVRQLTAEGQAAFLAESRLMSELRHPHIVRFLGAVYEADHLCMLLELCALSLHTLLHETDGAPLPPPHPHGGALRILTHVALGMYYLHARSPAVLHLNLKSANVLLDEHGTAKVSDFGLSVAKAESAVVTSHIGSPQWTAPEALRGQRPGAAADTYSFGMLLYEVFARALPYAGVDANYVHIGLLTRMLPRPTITEDVRRRSPPAAIALLERCWHEEPSARPPFSQIVDELERVAAAPDADPDDPMAAWKAKAAAKRAAAGEPPAAPATAPAAADAPSPARSPPPRLALHSSSSSSSCGVARTSLESVLTPRALESARKGSLLESPRKGSLPAVSEDARASAVAAAVAETELGVSVDGSEERRGDDGKPFTVYLISITLSGERWSVQRRYREFVAVHEAVRRQNPFVPELPKGGIARWWQRNDKAVVSVRREQLHRYIAELVANDQWILPEYADVRQFLQIPVALWRARGLAEQSLAPPLSARQTSVSAGSARKNSAISSMSGHSNGSLPAVRTSVMVSNHL